MVTTLWLIGIAIIVILATLNVFNLTAFIVYCFCSLSFCTFWGCKKYQKRPAQGVQFVCSFCSQVALQHSSAVANSPFVSWRSNRGNGATRFTHYRQRMAQMLKQSPFCSSIGTNTHCLTYSAGFLLKVTFVREERTIKISALLRLR